MEDTCVKEHAIQILESSGEEELDRFLDSQTEPETLIRLCSNLLIHFYWDRKDLTAALKYGELGIKCYSMLCNDETTCQEASSEIDHTAKSIHYNIASFTWPGWCELGISIEDKELSLGFYSARMNLELAQNLRRGLVPEGRAFWLLACHLVARSDYSEASAHFRSSADLFQKADKTDEELMAIGFLQMTQILAGDTNAEVNLKSTLNKLSELDGGREFIGQIETALNCFRESQQGGAPNPLPAE